MTISPDTDAHWVLTASFYNAMRKHPDKPLAEGVTLTRATSTPPHGWSLVYRGRGPQRYHDVDVIATVEYDGTSIVAAQWRCGNKVTGAFAVGDTPPEDRALCKPCEARRGGGPRVQQTFSAVVDACEWPKAD